MGTRAQGTIEVREVTHTHWPDDKGPVCYWATKRECDLRLAADKREAKARYEAEQVRRAEAKRNKGELDFMAYQAKEAARAKEVIRIRDGGPPA